MYEELFIYDIADISASSKVVLSGISYCDGNYSINRPNSSFSTLEYVISGTGTIYLDGQKYTASAGDVYFLPHGRDQYYFSSKDDPWVKIFFNLTGNLGIMLAQEYGFSGKVVLKNCNIESLMRELISFQAEKLTPLNMQQKSLLHIHKIFMEIHYILRQTAVFSAEFNEIKDYIDTHIIDRINLDELANHIYRSKNYVINLFKENMGKSPYEYYLERKMNLAKKMLADTSLPIQQISEYLSFENSNYFSNCFKKRFGCSPSHYRKNV